MKRVVFVLALLLALVLLAGHPYHSTGGGTHVVPSEGVIVVDGLVNERLEIQYNELRRMPSRNVTAVLYCVDEPDTPLKNGTWRGVPLSYILNRAGVKGNAIKVALYASDGYTTDLRVDYVMSHENVIVAYEFNGKPIPPRLVVPGMWGYKWIKHLTEVKLVDYNFLGTWERAGYPDDAYIVRAKGRSAT